MPVPAVLWSCLGQTLSSLMQVCVQLLVQGVGTHACIFTDVTLCALGCGVINHGMRQSGCKLLMNIKQRK